MYMYIGTLELTKTLYVLLYIEDRAKTKHCKFSKILQLYLPQIHSNVTVANRIYSEEDNSIDCQCSAQPEWFGHLLFPKIRIIKVKTFIQTNRLLFLPFVQYISGWLHFRALKHSFSSSLALLKKEQKQRQEVQPLCHILINYVLSQILETSVKVSLIKEM